ncbi:MAG: ATP-binding protein [Bacteroidota bacterium]|nr:ATP-binding protein [Bacteroidota bacterium]
MKRQIDSFLEQWKNKPARKTLLLRGARQVGKTYSIRVLGKGFKYFLEINFESDKAIHKFFNSDLKPNEICKNLSVYYDVPIIDGETLLFFDEIQACLPAISSLRFFYEKRPSLHVAAAGSLLEFAMEEIPSYGLGRINPIFMYPMSFNEFLWAINEEKLCLLKQDASPDNPLNPVFHTKLINYLKQFLLTGGLPEVVNTYIETNDLRQSQIVLDELINGLDDDFAKYKKLVPVSWLRNVFEAVVVQSGNKFNYSKVSTNANHQQLKEALNLLEMAGLVYKVTHTSANGLPLGAQLNHKKFKAILYDHGVFQKLLGLDLSNHLLATDFSAINKGKLAEQFVGTELVKYSSFWSKPKLYYWHREKRGSMAEVDYIIQDNESILPLEVKSGMQGKMQSLWVFLREKNIQHGVRISLENFSHYNSIKVFPLYAVDNILTKNKTL